MTVVGDDWRQNATYRLGIPLHPLGELNVFEYIIQAKDDLEEMRTRTTGAMIQLTVNVVANYVFIRNLWLSLRMLFRRHNVIPHWCCFLQAAFGLAYTIFALLLTMPNGPSCRITLWNIGIGLTVSSLCVSTTLLQKAYIVCGQNRLFLIFGIMCILPQVVTGYFAWSSPSVMVPGIGCKCDYPHYFPWVKFCVEAPTIILFSVVFLRVVYQQYHLFGSDAWIHLARNGIQTMCLVVFSNFTCMLLAAIDFLGPFSQMFFVLDWTITSLLLVSHGIHVGFRTKSLNPQENTNMSKTATLLMESDTLNTQVH
jgi:hypothetical protein